MILVSIACNDPDNGNFRGRASSIHWGNNQDMELQHNDWYRGVAVTYVGDDRVRICRRVFRFKRHKDWYGNWCWNAFWMERAEAWRLLRYLRQSGKWKSEGGPCRLFDWFNRYGRFAPSGSTVRADDGTR